MSMTMHSFHQVKSRFSVIALADMTSVILESKRFIGNRANMKGQRWILKNANVDIDTSSTFQNNTASVKQAFARESLMSFMHLIVKEAQKLDCRLRMYKSHRDDPDLIIEFDPSCSFERGEQVGLPQTQKHHPHRVDLTQYVRYLTIGFPQKSERTIRKEQQKQNEHRIEQVRLARIQRQRMTAFYKEFVH